MFTLVASHLLGIPRGVSCYTDHTLADYDLKCVSLNLRHSRLIVATSKRIKRELLEIAPDVPPERIVVKPNAINADRFPALERAEPGSDEPYRLVCVSRMDPKKGLVFLVRALRLLRDRNRNVEVHLVGSVDQDQQGSRDYARELDAEIEAVKV